jgi:hypothetical protein
MDTSQILITIEEEIARLGQVKALLEGAEAPRTQLKRGPKPGKKPQRGTMRIMSPQGRARIAAAQKARWAKAK